MKAKGPTTQFGGVKEVKKSAAAPASSGGGGRSTSAASGSKITHHAPLHTDHKRSNKHTRSC